MTTPTTLAEYPGVLFYKPETSNISPEAKIGKGTVIHSHVTIMDGVVIGKNCKIQGYVYIPPGVTIGDDVFIGPGTVFTNDRQMDGGRQGTVVENFVKIGAHCTILPVEIVEGAMIGAHSLVNRDVVEPTIWFGVPARKQL